MHRKQYYTYITSNYNRTVLYVGITDNLIKRVWQHKNFVADGFTSKYKATDLLYYEIFADPQNAITREKQMKSWSRKRKDDLILRFNLNREDLYETIQA